MARPAAVRVNSRSPAIDQKEKLIAATERLVMNPSDSLADGDVVTVAK